MLRGPANRPAVLFPALVAVVLVTGLLLGRAWLELGVVVAVVVLREVWRGIGPQRRAGRVRRSWPWHDG